MCRLLYIQSPHSILPQQYLGELSNIAQNSKKWQGDGWGVAYKGEKDWGFYRSLRPIWHDEQSFSDIPATTNLFVHARGALLKGTISLEYVHPFSQGDWIFAFNGLLRGVRLHVPGGIGAIKVFNLLLQTIKEEDDIAKSITMVSDRLVAESRSYTAINFVLVNIKTSGVFVHSRYSEDPDYFAIRVTKADDGTFLACSQEFGNYAWRRMKSGEVIRA